ncbi:MAG: type II toxin-antitoxin system mRNA interferase toxin, RelE/StbE family [Candidatus Levybacteria bacterium]|nr:type II toxin-antitoxin system mRNA interferase toxin, RelE/StbE family [Candidatus Levybacteria bacterium]
MTIRAHRKFVKDYNKLTKSQKKKFKERRNLFLQDEFSPILNNHALTGEYKGFRSINISGDLRAIFRREKDSVLFIVLDKHSNLYG